MCHFTVPLTQCSSVSWIKPLMRPAGCTVTLMLLFILLNALKPINRAARQPASPIQQGTCSRRFTCLRGLEVLWLNCSAAAPGKGARCAGGEHMVFCWVLARVAPGSHFPMRSVADTERGLQLLPRVTFITTINMHATHRQAGLQLMPAPKKKQARRGCGQPGWHGSLKNNVSSEN